MVRRGQQDKQAKRRAERQAAEQLGSDHGAYQVPEHDKCRQKQWESPYDNANTVRLQFITWHKGRKIASFVVNVQVLASTGWNTVEYFDCCHGCCHYHPKSGADPRTVLRLDAIEDVQRAFKLVEREADDRARIIRGEGA